MNNFRNPYVDPDSFQGKVYDYFRKTTNSHSIHSIDNQVGSDQKETQQSQKNIQSDKTKKHSIYINHQLEKINDSRPILFSPPKVDSIQKPLNENTIDELAFNIAQSKDSENEEMDKKEEVVSNLIKEFSLMLDDTPSIHEGLTTLQEGKFENDSLLNSSESTSITENKLGDEYANDTDYKNVPGNHVHTKHENSELLFDEFHSMLDERDNQLISDGENIESLNKHHDTMEDKFFTMYAESESVDLQEEKQDIDTNEEDNDALNENTDKMEDKFYTMLSESDDDLQEEKQDIDTNEEDNDALNENTDKMEDNFYTMLSESEDELQEEKQDSSFTSLKEKKSVELEVLSKGELHLYHKKPSFKKVKKRKYCINQNNQYNRTCLKEVDDEQFFRKNTHLINPVAKKKTITVKMQVLLTRLEIDIDIVKTIDLLMPLENILKVEWSIHSLDCKVVSPSKTVFLKGEFIAEIEYSNKGLENKIQSIKVSIPWSKKANIKWLSVPDFPHSNQNEFMFQSQHEHDPSFHYKYHQRFTEPIRSQLKQINFVWHQKLNSKDQQLQINGVAQLSIHFMQEQFVDLDCNSK